MDLVPNGVLQLALMNLSHQVSCSVLLAAALTEFFPAAKLKSFQATEKCFFCDLVFPFPFEKEAFSLLEERMRILIKKDLPFHLLEMTPPNAAQYLNHHGFPSVAEAAGQRGDFVKIISLDRFAGIASGKPLESTGEIKFFKLFQVIEFNGITRILGTSADSKPSLKSQLQSCAHITSHLHLACDLKLMTPLSKSWIWLPRGEVLKNLLMKELLNFSEIDAISTPALEEASLRTFHAEYCLQTQRGAWECFKTKFEGTGHELLDPEIATQVRISLPLNESSVISFLQIIAKFFTIFPFDARVVAVGKVAKILKDHVTGPISQERGLKPRIEFRLQDSLGREWAGPCIWIEGQIVVLSLFSCLERFLALLLEKTQGELPFRFQPEQIRILELKQGCAGEVCDSLRKAGFRVGVDFTPAPLQKRLSSVLRERVPFSIVIGERDKQPLKLAVRDTQSGKVESMEMETLIERLRQLES